MVALNMNMINTMSILLGSLRTPKNSSLQIQHQSQMSHSSDGGEGGWQSPCCHKRPSHCCDPCDLDPPEEPIDPFEGITTDDSTLSILVNIRWPLKDVNWYLTWAEELHVGGKPRPICTRSTTTTAPTSTTLSITTSTTTTPTTTTTTDTTTTTPPTTTTTTTDTTTTTTPITTTTTTDTTTTPITTTTTTDTTTTTTPINTTTTTDTTTTTTPITTTTTPITTTTTTDTTTTTTPITTTTTPITTTTTPITTTTTPITTTTTTDTTTTTTPITTTTTPTTTTTTPITTTTTPITTTTTTDTTTTTTPITTTTTPITTTTTPITTTTTTDTTTTNTTTTTTPITTTTTTDTTTTTTPITTTTTTDTTTTTTPITTTSTTDTTTTTPPITTTTPMSYNIYRKKREVGVQPISTTPEITCEDLEDTERFVRENDVNIIFELEEQDTTQQQRAAFATGSQELEAIDNLEAQIFMANIILNDSASLKHQVAFRRTHPNSINISRGAILLEKATESFVSQFDVLTQKSLVALPLIRLEGDNSTSRHKREITPCQRKFLKDRRQEIGYCDTSDPYRTLDGTCNNILVDHIWGASFIPYRRNLPADYDDGMSTIRRSVVGNLPLPSARLVSTTINTVPSEESSAYSILHMTYGQFIDHDLVATPITTGYLGGAIKCCNLPPPFRHRFGCLPIEIPANDPFYSCYGQTCMEFTRSASFFDRCSFGRRQQGNQHTAYLDGSVIYGFSNEESDALRTFDCGLLKTQLTASGQPLLPPDMNPNDGCNTPHHSNKREYCFKAGDGRANEQILLTFFQTLFAREHNRLAKILKDCHDDWDDEKLFQEARRIVGAQLQQVTYSEFLPTVFGPTLMTTSNLYPLKGRAQTTDYDPYMDASIANNFATAAYRFGHSLIADNLLYVTKQGKTSPKELSTLFFNPFELYRKNGMCDVARGGINLPELKMDSYFTDQVTGKLFRGDMPFGLDLLALNIQRGRDHGLPSYNKWRKYCHLQEAQDFDDLLDIMSEERVEALRAVYESVDDVDLYVGGVSENPLPGALVGHTFSCLIHNQFFRMKYGDRYWFEYKNGPGAFTKDQIEQLHEVTLARIMCNNLPELEYIQRWPLRNPGPDNPKVCCKSIRQYSLKPWNPDCDDDKDEHKDCCCKE